ncbi:UDP-N-acetylglucosamine transferase subunit, partial [Dimargaris cristalligena]
MFALLFTIFLALVTAFAWRVHAVVPYFRPPRPVQPLNGQPTVGKPVDSSSAPIITLGIVLGSDYQNIYRRRTYFVTDTDRASADKARNFEAQLNQADSSYTIETIPRSREVGQTWLSTPVSVARTFYTAFPLLYQKTPDLLLTNGPGSCVPLVTSCLLLQ